MTAPPDTGPWLPWGQAMDRALYGPDGFYRREEPAAHFATSTGLPGFAAAVRELADRVDVAMGKPGAFDVVDLGAGGGELLAGLGRVPARWRLTAVDVRGRPAGAHDRVHWRADLPTVTGLLIANEWLDTIPLDLVSAGHLVEVSPAGGERQGQRAPAAALAWCRRWWPEGNRAEVGLSRDRAWATAVAAVTRGLAVAVDYGHLVATRRPTLTGYRAGRQVAPAPDGSCDLTAHVALDSCAEATGSRLMSQHAALRALGVTAALPRAGPGFAAGLQRASEAIRLLDLAGLGGFGWLVRPVGIADPLTLPP